MYYCLLHSDGKISQVSFNIQPSGGIEITSDIANNPQDYTYQNGQFVYTPDLLPRKQAKIEELLAKRDQTINSQFVSTTTGHTYFWGVDDQRKVHGQITLLNLDSTITSVDWLTKDAGMITHTRDQFIAVFKEGGQFERDQHTKFYSLESNVNLATTPDAINGVVW